MTENARLSEVEIRIAHLERGLQELSDVLIRQQKELDRAVERTRILADRLAALQDRAMHFKPYNTEPGARRLPDELAEDLVRTMSESRTQTQALDAKRHEELDTRAQFDSDIQRYHDLTTRPHS